MQAPTAVTPGGDAPPAAAASPQTLLEHVQGLPAPKKGALTDELTALKCRRTLKGHFGKVYALDWATHNPHHLVSASQDGTLKIWNTEDSNKLASIPLRSSWVMTCAFSPSGNLVASGGLDNVITLTQVNVKTPKVTGELQGHEGYVSCARFTTADMLISSSGDNHCLLWDVLTQQLLHTFRGHTADVMCIAVGSNRNIFVSVSTDNSAIVFDFRTKGVALAYPGAHGADLNTVTFFPDGGAFVTGSDDSSCKIFDIRSTQALATYSVDDGSITGVAVSPSGRTLYATANNDVVAWKITESNQRARVIDTHDARASCIGISHDGTRIASGSWDTLLKVSW